jgi:hypothetical protein
MRVRALLALVPLAFVLLAGGNAAADTAPPSFPIMPNQYFNGVVNGKTADATVYTACPGPATGQTGHPVGGQTLMVVRASPTGSADGLGFTGGLGTSIAAAPVTSSVANTPVVITVYNQASALPIGWTVPCEGSGLIAFAPKPTSSTARTDYVTVRFVNIAV